MKMPMKMKKLPMKMKFFVPGKKAASSYGGLYSISNMLFTHGLAGTVDYYCNISVFSID